MASRSKRASVPPKFYAEEAIAAEKKTHVRDSKSNIASPVADWPNVFAQCMVLVSVLPPPVDAADGLIGLFNGIHAMRIEHANADFWKTFGYYKMNAVLLKDLFGPASSADKVARIEACVLTGREQVEYINLYNARRQVLFSHVSVYTIRGTRNTPVMASPSYPSSSLGFATSGLDCYNADGTVSDPRSRDTNRRYAMLTIRCSSVVSHAKESGMGLLGPDRVTDEAKNEYLQRLQR